MALGLYILISYLQTIGNHAPTMHVRFHVAAAGVLCCFDRASNKIRTLFIMDLRAKNPQIFRQNFRLKVLCYFDGDQTLGQGHWAFPEMFTVPTINSFYQGNICDLFFLFEGLGFSAGGAN